jgi:hypothetical protein
MPFNTNTTNNSVVYMTSEQPVQAMVANDTSAAANNSNTVAVLNDFTFTVGKYERFAGEIQLWYFAHQDKDFRFQLLSPANSTLRWNGFIRKVDGAFAEEGQEVTNGTGSIIGVTTTNTNDSVGFLRLNFAIINGGTLGTFTFKWAANNAVNDTSELVYVKAGSLLKYKRF